MRQQKRPQNFDREVGARIKARRKQLGMSQGGLGKRLGITFQQVQKYEKGTNRVGASRLYGVCEALNVPIGFFFDGSNDGEMSAEHPELDDFVSSQEGKALNEAFARVSDPLARARIVELVQSLADAFETDR